MSSDSEDNDAQQKKKVIVCAAAAAAVAEVVMPYITRHPYRGEVLRGQSETERIIRVSDYTCRAQVRMKRAAFFNLCALVRDMGLLTDSQNLNLEEQLCMFLFMIGHNGKNRQLVNIFSLSGHTVSQYFNIALNAIIKLYLVLLPPPSTVTHQKIRDSPRRYYPYFKKTEQRYWKDHPVLPIHVETLLWLGNEIATGDHALHPCEIPNESEQEGFTAEVPIHDGMNEDGADGSPLASELPSNQTVCSSRRRGRPHANSTSEQPKKKKKGIAEKVTSPLKEMANALKIMATEDTEMDFAKLVNAAVKEMDGYDKQQKVRARRYLLNHKMEAKSILSAPKTERVEMLEEYMDEESSP